MEEYGLKRKLRLEAATWGALWKTCNFIKKETLAQLFSLEFCEISENSFFTEHPWTAASIRLISEFATS